MQMDDRRFTTLELHLDEVLDVALAHLERLGYEFPAEHRLIGAEAEFLQNRLTLLLESDQLGEDYRWKGWVRGWGWLDLVRDRPLCTSAAYLAACRQAAGRVQALIQQHAELPADVQATLPPPAEVVREALTACPSSGLSATERRPGTPAQPRPPRT